MKINDTSVTGVFVYTDNARFEENDFVIFDGTIYICKPKTGEKYVSGEKPKWSENYIVYLGDQSMNISEYLDFLETAEGENKYLSVLTLQQVLNSYMLGPDGKGVIGEYVKYESAEEYEVTLSDTQGTAFTDPNSVIADIMNHPDINHAMLRVSRLLPEIVVYVGDPKIETMTTTDTKSCILRQYSYISEEGHKIRVQELIDPVDGLIYYRSADTTRDTVSSATNFKCATVNTQALKNKADNIFSLYNSRLKVLRSLEEHLKSNFRYRRLEIKGKHTDLDFLGISKNLPELTVMITEVTTGGLRKNSEISYSLSDRGDSGEIPEYEIGEGYKIQTILSSDDSVHIFLKTKAGAQPSSSRVWISGAYYREYYDL